MKNHNQEFNVEKMAQILGVGRSSYYEFIIPHYMQHKMRHLLVGGGYRHLTSKQSIRAYQFWEARILQPNTVAKICRESSSLLFLNACNRTTYIGCSRRK